MDDIQNLICRVKSFRYDPNPFLAVEDIITLNEFWILMDYIHKLEKVEKNWKCLNEHVFKTIMDSKAGSSQYYDYINIHKFMNEIEGELV